MEDHSNISDTELHKLLKQRLLEHADDDLLEAEAKLVFATTPVIVPSAEKQKELIEKLTARKTGFRFKKWILFVGMAVAILSALFYFSSNKSNQDSSTVKVDNASEYQVNKNTLENQPSERIADEDTSRNNFSKQLPGSRYRGQIIEKILKKNADCTGPVLIIDTIVFSPHTPKGSGNEMEIFDNKADDQLYFENEHNTIWYKFIAPQTGQFTFDLIPEDKNDDYDFMLFKYNGDDFQSKVISKEVKPIRTCISRNDKKINSMTGLFIDLELPSYVHSGEGASYVKYITVKKGEVYYLLVDNVYNNGNGHTILLHYKPFKPGELYVGQKSILKHVTFKDSDDEFRPGTKYTETIDSLYEFLLDNPGIKIEVQGHVNSNPINTLTKIDGKPYHTDQELSQLRAEKVCKILYKKGVDFERLVPRGYAGTRKKIELPKNKEECYMNIRIEVLILSLDYKKEPEYIKKHKKEKMAAR